MSNAKKEEIKKINFEKTNIIINETYIDENGHERDKQKNINISSLDDIDVNKIKSIAEKKI